MWVGPLSMEEEETLAMQLAHTYAQQATRVMQVARLPAQPSPRPQPPTPTPTSAPAPAPTLSLDIPNPTQVAPVIAISHYLPLSHTISRYLPPSPAPR